MHATRPAWIALPLTCLFSLLSHRLGALDHDLEGNINAIDGTPADCYEAWGIAANELCFRDVPNRLGRP